ncbi:MAG: tetratricopeptide (TPR) repeat protein [Paracoccaceae bacterium]|jgi:tetratricopeptide (TPR) repeat protein
MTFEHPNLKRIVAEFAAIFVIFLLLCLPLTAQEADSQDEAALLEALGQADPATAQRLDRQLKALWGKSGSASMDLLLKRGRDALEVDDSRAAIEHLTALTDHAPDFAEGWHARARAFFEAGLYGPALADLERTLRLNPNHYDAILGLGAILETFEDPQRAYQAYLRAQAIHPHHVELGKALERLKPLVEGKAL